MKIVLKGITCLCNYGKFIKMWNFFPHNTHFNTNRPKIICYVLCTTVKEKKNETNFIKIRHLSCI